MPQHEIIADIHTKAVLNKDVRFEVKVDGAKLGTLLISKGNVEWLPKGNSVNKFRMSWTKLASHMETHGNQVKK